MISIQTHRRPGSVFSWLKHSDMCFTNKKIELGEHRVARSEHARSGYVRLTHVAARLRVYIHALMSCNKPNCFVWVNNVWIASSSDSLFSTDRHLWLQTHLFKLALLCNAFIICFMSFKYTSLCCLNLFSFVSVKCPWVTWKALINKMYYYLLLFLFTSDGLERNLQIFHLKSFNHKK